MQILLKEHRRFVIALLDAEVEFILIGGYAVIYHGYPRNTDDLDVWLLPAETNKKKFIAMLEKEGIQQEDLLQLAALDFNSPQVFHIGEPPDRIDFLTKVRGLNFDEAQKLQVYFDLDRKKVPVLNFDHLIISKLLSDRPQDRADAAMLQKSHRLKSDDEKK